MPISGIDEAGLEDEDSPGPKRSINVKKMSEKVM